MTIRFLVVNIDPQFLELINNRFKKKIKNGIYKFEYVANGVEAVKRLKIDSNIDIVLTDINLPATKGMTLLTYLKRKKPTIKSIVISNHDEIRSIRLAMNRGAYDFITMPVDPDDLEKTIDKTIIQVQELKNTLKSIQENDVLKLYVGEEALNFMIQDEFQQELMHNEKIEGSIMFVDICGFTVLSEQQPANVVISLLNKYFDLIVPEIITKGGRVDKFLGDAVMSVFQGEQHNEKAIETAISIREKIDSLNKENLGDSSYTPKVSIGINSGEVISGNIGSETFRRLDYTVIGDVVNTASRLENVATSNQILVTEEFYNQLNGSIIGERIMKTHLKNKQEVSVIFNILELSSNVNFKSTCDS
ncbi:MAG: adenylate/guanylate cyclase domain-containing protein [Balneolales bacterium]